MHRVFATCAYWAEYAFAVVLAVLSPLVLLALAVWPLYSYGPTTIVYFFIFESPGGAVLLVVGMISNFWKCIGGLFVLLRYQGVAIDGTVVSLKDEPGLSELLHSLCRECRVKMPQNIVFGCTSEFSTIYGTCIVDNVKLFGHTLIIGYPCLSWLTKNELASLLTHELSHVRSRDSLLHRIVYPVYRGLSAGKASIRKVYYRKGCLKWILFFGLYYILLVSYMALSLYFWAFHVVNMSVRRKQEYRADVRAVKAMGAAVYRSALLKVAGFEMHFNEFVENYGMAEIEELGRDGQLFRRLCDESADVVGLGLVAAAAAVPDDFHPTFAHRFLTSVGVFAPDEEPILLDQFHPALDERLRAFPNAGTVVFDDVSLRVELANADRYEKDLTPLLLVLIKSRVVTG